MTRNVYNSSGKLIESWRSVPTNPLADSELANQDKIECLLDVLLYEINAEPPKYGPPKVPLNLIEQIRQLVKGI